MSVDDKKIKYIRERDCFTVSVDYKKYEIFRTAAKQHPFIKQYWELHPVTFIFISISNKEIHDKEPEHYKGYHAYIGDDGDDNLFDLGAWTGTKENLIENIENGSFFSKQMEENKGFEYYRTNQYLKNILSILRPES